jgi:hypothetical protein
LMWRWVWYLKPNMQSRSSRQSRVRMPSCSWLSWFSCGECIAWPHTHDAYMSTTHVLMGTVRQLCW